MGVQRGRFSVASVGGFIYAVGGSDGFREQRELEYYDPNQKIWITRGEARNAKVSQGILNQRCISIEILFNNFNNLKFL